MERSNPLEISARIPGASRQIDDFPTEIDTLTESSYYGHDQIDQNARSLDMPHMGSGQELPNELVRRMHESIHREKVEAHGLEGERANFMYLNK